jgi:hypothetical protein
MQKLHSTAMVAGSYCFANSRRSRAWEIARSGQKKVDDEGIRFHTLLTAGVHRGGWISPEKGAAVFCSWLVLLGGGAGQRRCRRRWARGKARRGGRCSSWQRCRGGTVQGVAQRAGAQAAGAAALVVATHGLRKHRAEGTAAKGEQRQRSGGGARLLQGRRRGGALG